MNKIFTYALCAAGLLSGGVSAMAAPLATGSVKLFSLTVNRSEIDGTMQIDLGANDGQKVQVDWGNGEISDPVVIGRYQTGSNDEFNPTSVKGVVAGTTITFYGADPKGITFLGAEWTRFKDSVTGEVEEEAKIKSVEISSLTSLRELLLSYNQLTALDLTSQTNLVSLDVADNNLVKDNFKLPASTTLTSINVSNNFNVATGVLNEGAGSNQVLGTDWSLCPNLNILNVSGNDYLYVGWFDSDSFDVSKNTKLTTLTMNGCKQSSVDLSANTALKTFNGQWNGFTSLNVSSMVAKGSIVFVAHNKLSRITLPETDASNKMLRVNLSYNNFTFSNLPTPGMTANSANYVYANQSKIKASLSASNTIDFTSLAKVGDTASVFVWKSGDEVLSNYTDQNGVFTFTSDVKDAVCEITNAVFPNLTLSTTASTSLGLLPVMFTMDVVPDGDKKTSFVLASNNPAGQDIFIDWGDGNYVGPFTVPFLSYEWTPDTKFESVPKGDKITVKGEPTTLESLMSNGTWKFADKSKTSIFADAFDLSALTTLKYLDLKNNDLTKIDLSANQELRKVVLESNMLKTFSASLPKLETLNVGNYVSSNKYQYGDNAITSLSFSKLPKLKSLTVSGLKLKTLNFSEMPNIESVYAIASGIETVVPAGDKLTYLSLNSNNLKAIDLSGITAKCNVFLIGNQLESIVAPYNIGNLNVSNNKLTFATLPEVSSISGTLTYSPQAAMPLPVKWNNTVDLASQYAVDEVATTFTWKKDDGSAFNGKYDVKDGVFKFEENFEKISCDMKNASFPKLTLTTEALTSPSLLYTKMLSLDAKPDGAKTVTFAIGHSTADGQKVYVDYGNGDVVGPFSVPAKGTGSVADNIVGVPAGDVITVYGLPADVHTFKCNGAYDWASSLPKTIMVTGGDFSALENLTELNLNYNLFTSALDLSKNQKLEKFTALCNNFDSFSASLPKLTSLDLSNYGSSFKYKYGKNNVKTIDFEAIPALRTLTLNYNNAEGEARGFDFSAGQNLEIITSFASSLTSVTLPAGKLYDVNVGYNKLENLDASAMVASEGFSGKSLKVNATNNALYEVKINPATTVLNLSANKLMGASEAPEADDVNLSQNALVAAPSYPKASTLNLSGNALTYYSIASGKMVDLSKNQLCYVAFGENALVENLNVSDNLITDLDLSAQVKLNTLNVAKNRLTWLDASKMFLLEESGFWGPSKTLSIDASDNQLKEVTIPEGTQVLKVEGNALTFATLPAVSAVADTYKYANQAAVAVEAKENVVDLSALAVAGDKVTSFVWKSGETEIAPADYNVAEGVFTFSKVFGNAVCTMTNESFPLLTLSTVPVQITLPSAVVGVESDNAPVEYFNLQGVKVSGLEPGVYVRRQGNKTSKVVVR